MKRAAIVLTIMTAILAFMLASCGGNSARAAVKSDLERLRTSETAPSQLASVQEDLPEEAGQDFEAFLSKVRDFDYKVLGIETVSEDGEEYTIVNVKITSYDFGKEYLATWTDYLKNHGDASVEDAEGGEFLTGLFSRLSKLDKKDHISFVEIKAAQDPGSGEWTTDIRTNEDLQNALFGGMISEMKTLADE